MVLVEGEDISHYLWQGDLFHSGGGWCERWGRGEEWADALHILTYEGRLFMFVAGVRLFVEPGSKVDVSSKLGKSVQCPPCPPITAQVA